MEANNNDLAMVEGMHTWLQYLRTERLNFTLMIYDQLAIFKFSWYTYPHDIKIWVVSDHAPWHCVRCEQIDFIWAKLINRHCTTIASLVLSCMCESYKIGMIMLILMHALAENNPNVGCWRGFPKVRSKSTQCKLPLWFSVTLLQGIIW